MSQELIAFNRVQSNLKSGVESAIADAVSNVFSNVQAYITERVTESLTPAVMAQLYPHEVMTDEERLSEAKQFACDILCSSIKSLESSFVQAAIVKKAGL